MSRSYIGYKSIVLEAFVTCRVCSNIQKHWVDTKCNSDCFFVDADNLKIGDGDKPISLGRQTSKERTAVDVAVLKGVCWLDVVGKFETAKLTPKTTYEVVFLIELKQGYEWENAVNVRLILPDGKIREEKQNFAEKEKDKEIEILVGEYVASTGQRTSEVIEFSIYEKSDTQWKGGLVIIGAKIRPKRQDQVLE